MYALAQPSCRELLNDLLLLAKALQEFNALHAGGREMGLLLSELLHRGTPEEISSLTKTASANDSGNYHATCTNLLTQYSGTLQHTGLEICVDAGLAQAREIFSDYGINSSPLGTHFEAVTMHVAELVITDFKQFIGFLSELNTLRPPIPPTSNSIHLFRCIAGTLTATIERADLRRKLGYEDALPPHVLEHTQEVIDLLHDLQLSAVADELSEILQHALCSDLSDYLRAKRYNLLPQTEIGPKLWHRTMGLESFKSNWDMTLDVVKDIATGDSSFLAQSVRDHLHKVARNAYQEITFALNTARPALHFKENGPGMLIVLTKALESLSSLRDST